MNFQDANLICDMKEYVSWTQHIKNNLNEKKKIELCYDGIH